MNQTLIAIGEALIDFTPLQQGQALKDVSSFGRNCGAAHPLILQQLFLN